MENKEFNEEASLVTRFAVTNQIVFRSDRASRIGGTPTKVTAHAANCGCYLIQP